jgi:hypothetical protein
LLFVAVAHNIEVDIIIFHFTSSQVATNFIGSAAAMFYRYLPDKLGAQQVYNPSSEAFTTGGWQAAYDTVDRPQSAPSVADLSSGRLGELSSNYISKIQQDWYTCVLTYDSTTSASNPQCG